MRPRDLFLNAALAAMAWTPALSQSNPQSTPRFGIIGGANLATLTGSYFENTSNRTGFAAGLMAVLPVSPSFAIQPELMFTMKGANGNSGGISEVAKTDYIELPVLARFEIPASASVKPFVYGGPGFAYRRTARSKRRERSDRLRRDRVAGAPRVARGQVQQHGCRWNHRRRPRHRRRRPNDDRRRALRCGICEVLHRQRCEESRIVVHGHTRVAVSQINATRRRL